MIGGLIVAGLQRRPDQTLADGPERRPSLVAGWGFGEVVGKRERQHAVLVAHQIAGALEGQARGVLEIGRQGLDQGVGGVALAERHARPGQGLLIGRQDGDHVARGGALLAVQQHVGAADVVVDGEQIAEAGQHLALRLRFEHLVAPEVLDQGAGVVGTAQGPLGGGQRHGALGGLGRLAIEPGHHRLGRHRLGLELFLGGGLAAAGARPAPEVAPGLVELGEGHPLAGRIGHGPEHQLARDQVGKAGPQRIGARDVAGLAGLQRLAQSGHLVGGRRGLIAQRRGLHGRGRAVAGR